MAEWWYAEGSEQRGPISREELSTLLEGGKVRADTLVWTSGMATWTPAGLVPELGAQAKPPAEEAIRLPPVPPGAGRPEGLGAGTDAGSGAALAGTSAGTGGTSAASGPSYTYAREMRPNNHLLKAVLATILCCLPLGIVAIVKASQVNAIAESGDLDRARAASSEASKWGNWAIGIGLVGQLIYIAFIGLSGLFGFLGDGEF